jgi:MFS family permease
MALFAAGITYFVVAGISFPVLPRLVEDELGGSKTDIGLAFATFALGMLVVRPVAGVVSDRIGRRPLMIGGAVGIAVFQLLHVPAADTGELWVLLTVRVGTGAFSSLMYLAQATTATELPPERHRAKVFSTFSVAVFVGFAIGPIVGESVLQAHGFAWAFTVAAGFAIVSALVALTLPETKPGEVRPAEGLGDVFHPVAARIGLVNLLIFITFMGFNGFIQDYSEEFGIDEVRWLLLTYSGTTLVLRFGGGWVIDRFDRRNLATVAHSIVAVVLATATGAGQLYVGAFVIAIGMAWNVPLLMLIAVDSADDLRRPRQLRRCAHPRGDRRRVRLRRHVLHRRRRRAPCRRLDAEPVRGAGRGTPARSRAAGSESIATVDADGLAGGLPPTLLTRMSTRPKASSAASTGRTAVVRAPASAAAARARPPRAVISSTTVSRWPAVRELTTTAAPASAIAIARERPIPRPPPVTIATRSASAGVATRVSRCSRW